MEALQHSHSIKHSNLNICQIISLVTVISLYNLIVVSRSQISIHFFNWNCSSPLTRAFTRRGRHNNILWELRIQSAKDYSQQDTYGKHRESSYGEGIISGARNGRLRLGQINEWDSGLVNCNKVLFLGSRPSPFLGSLVFRPKTFSPHWGMSPVTSGASFLFLLAALHLRQLLHNEDQQVYAIQEIFFWSVA